MVGRHITWIRVPQHISSDQLESSIPSFWGTVSYFHVQHDMAICVTVTELDVSLPARSHVRTAHTVLNAEHFSYCGDDDQPETDQFQMIASEASASSQILEENQFVGTSKIRKYFNYFSALLQAGLKLVVLLWRLLKWTINLSIRCVQYIVAHIPKIVEAIGMTSTHFKQLSLLSICDEVVTAGSLLSDKTPWLTHFFSGLRQLAADWQWLSYIGLLIGFAESVMMTGIAVIKYQDYNKTYHRHVRPVINDLRAARRMAINVSTCLSRPDPQIRKTMNHVMPAMRSAVTRVSHTIQTQTKGQLSAMQAATQEWRTSPGTLAFRMIADTFSCGLYALTGNWLLLAINAFLMTMKYVAELTLHYVDTQYTKLIQGLDQIVNTIETTEQIWDALGIDEDPDNLLVRQCIGNVEAFVDNSRELLERVELLDKVTLNGLRIHFCDLVMSSLSKVASMAWTCVSYILHCSLTGFQILGRFVAGIMRSGMDSLMDLIVSTGDVIRAFVQIACDYAQRTVQVVGDALIWLRDYIWSWFM